MSSSEDQASMRSHRDSGASHQRGRNNTTPSYRLPSLQHHPSTRESRQTVSTIERQPTARLEPIDSSRTHQDRATAHTTCSRTQTAEDRAHQQESSIRRQQTEKKPEQSLYVDNDYYTLNPWYDQEPERPLFGLAQPLPRTVRPGMLWGRRGLRGSMYKVEHPKEQDDQEQEQAGQSRTGIDRRSSSVDNDYFSNQRVREDHQKDAPTFQVPIDERTQRGPAQDRFEAEIDGRRVQVQRVGSKEADQVLAERGINKEDHYPEQDERHRPSSESWMSHRHSEHGGGLSPVEEAKSVETCQTEQESKDIRERQQKELQDFYNQYRNPLARLRARYPEAPAEFVATTIYLFLGMAGSLCSITYPAPTGDYQTQSWAWGLAVMAGIYVGGGVSGAHLNPWISVSFSVFRGFPWRMCVIYSVTQLLAGFWAGALAWFIYRDAILYMDPQLTLNITGKAFLTIPQPYISTSTAFFNDFVSAALYVCIAFAIGDDSNTPPGSGMSALVFGLVNYLFCISMGFNGLGFNPARDLGPRFVAWWVGYGSETFSTGWWAYGPIGAGLSGSLVGALIYDVFIFVGGESPVNYHWPGPRDIRRRLRARKEDAKDKLHSLAV